MCDLTARRHRSPEHLVLIRSHLLARTRRTVLPHAPWRPSAGNYAAKWHTIQWGIGATLPDPGAGGGGHAHPPLPCPANCKTVVPRWQDWIRRASSPPLVKLAADGPLTTLQHLRTQLTAANNKETLHGTKPIAPNGPISSSSGITILPSLIHQ